MDVFDNGVLQNLLDSVILGSKLFVGVAMLCGATYFLFEYLKGESNDKE
jgi:hypothetical protein|tara:strand:+ start:512 stop:658 length:147 start_codon:yes stop_codon:yes gene_type:complete